MDGKNGCIFAGLPEISKVRGSIFWDVVIAKSSFFSAQQSKTRERSFVPLEYATGRNGLVLFLVEAFLGLFQSVCRLFEMTKIEL